MSTRESARIKFPHLLPGEVNVWRSYLLLYEDLFDRFQYDVHVGRGSLPEEGLNDVNTLDFNWLTRKRIDVVGWNGSQPTIFEVREHASLPLIGQLEGYRHLWMRDNPESPVPHKILVCNIARPDDIAVATDQDVTVVVVPPPGEKGIEND